MMFCNMATPTISPCVQAQLVCPTACGDLTFGLVTQVIELSKEQEKTKQVEAKSKQAEYEAAAKQAAVVQFQPWCQMHATAQAPEVGATNRRDGLAFLRLCSGAWILKTGQRCR